MLNIEGFVTYWHLVIKSCPCLQFYTIHWQHRQYKKERPKHYEYNKIITDNVITIPDVLVLLVIHNDHNNAAEVCLFCVYNGNYWDVKH